MLSIVGLAVGFTVGLTGMGGGALMTPILVLFFGVKPLAAVSSDLVASLIMKPVGAGVHWRNGTVHRELVRCLGLTGSLVVGAIPGVWLGARVSSRAPSGLVRKALAVVLMASGLKLVDVGNALLGGAVLAAVLAGPPLWRLVKVTHGLRTWPARAPST
jgi:uncharacterized membrane protein YfcA